MRKRVVALITAISLMFSICPVFALPAFADETAPISGSDIKLGDYAHMGKYYGDEILWRRVGFEKIAGYDGSGVCDMAVWISS